jgi:hypothetical protein
MECDSIKIQDAQLEEIFAARLDEPMARCAWQSGIAVFSRQVRTEFGEEFTCAGIDIERLDDEVTKLCDEKRACTGRIDFTQYPAQMQSCQAQICICASKIQGCGGHGSVGILDNL